MLSRRVCNHNNIRKRARSPGNRCPLARHPAGEEEPKRASKTTSGNYTRRARRVSLFDGLFLHTQRRTQRKLIIIILLLRGFMTFFSFFFFRGVQSSYVYTAGTDGLKSAVNGFFAFERLRRTGFDLLGP